MSGNPQFLRRSSRFAAPLVFAAAAAQPRPPHQQESFHEKVVLSGLTNPTVVRFLPDGRVLVAEKSGLIKMFANLTNTTTVVADLRTPTHNFWDRGLLGLAVPPGFDPASPEEWRRSIYVLYTHDALTGGVAPKWGVVNGTSDPCPAPPRDRGPRRTAASSAAISRGSWRSEPTGRRASRC